MLDVRELSTSALAYLGDCVLELLVREKLVTAGLSRSGQLHTGALEYVKASAQADAMDRILPRLTEEEAGIYRRGRNNGHLNVPKNASRAEYRRATGMEVLFGYLHVTEQAERLRELFAVGYPEQNGHTNGEAPATPTEEI